MRRQTKNITTPRPKSGRGPRAVISRVEAGSPAALGGLAAGDILVSINGGIIRDVIDFQLLAAEQRLEIEFRRDDEKHLASIETDGDGRLGIYFDKSVFDRLKTCRNRCAFCFVDQLPAGCRESLLIKDDDFRLSFLYGNFVTLTNLGRSDIERVIDQRLSPLYVSLHSTDTLVRERLLSPPRLEKTLENLTKLLEGGIEIHIQIVACPGMNDGPDLRRTLNSLREDFSGIASVGIVPVGLTGHREGLPDLRTFELGETLALLDEVGLCREAARRKYGYNWVYAADEFYLTVGRAMPEESEYDDFPQIENGIGLTRRFIDDFLEAIRALPEREAGADGAVGAGLQSEGAVRAGLQSGTATVITGQLGASIFRSLAPLLEEDAGIELRIIEAANKWLGGKVSVAALLAGSDIVTAVREARTAGPVLFPAHCLNADRLFLDDMTLGQVQEATGVEMVPVPPAGTDLAAALLAAGSARA